VAPRFQRVPAECIAGDLQQAIAPGARHRLADHMEERGQALVAGQPER